MTFIDYVEPEFDNMDDLLDAFSEQADALSREDGE